MQRKCVHAEEMYDVPLEIRLPPFAKPGQQRLQAALVAVLGLFVILLAVFVIHTHFGRGRGVAQVEIRKNALLVVSVDNKLLLDDIMTVTFSTRATRHPEVRFFCAPMARYYVSNTAHVDTTSNCEYYMRSPVLLNTAGNART